MLERDSFGSIVVLFCFVLFWIRLVDFGYVFVSVLWTIGYPSAGSRGVGCTLYLLACTNGTRKHKLL
jgi:hypothetical protein